MYLCDLMLLGIYETKSEYTYVYTLDYLYMLQGDPVAGSKGFNTYSSPFPGTIGDLFDGYQGTIRIILIPVLAFLITIVSPAEFHRADVGFIMQTLVR